MRTLSSSRSPVKSSRLSGEDVELLRQCVEVAPVWVRTRNGKKVELLPRVRSAVTGRFDKRGRAKTSPRTTVTERFRRNTGKKTGQEEAVSGTQSFKVVEAELNGAPGVAIRGEIDLDAVPSLESALDTAIRSTAGAFVLDLCDLDFLDSSGLRVMLRARARLAREDRELAIVCPHGPVRRLFEVVGIADLLFLYASRDDAAAALVPAD